MILLKKSHYENEEKACEIGPQKVIHANDESGLDSVRALVLGKVLGPIREKSEWKFRAR